LKENVEKRAKLSRDFRLSEWTKWSRGVLSCFCDSKIFQKAIHHEIVAVLQENAVSCSSVTRFDSAERLFGPELGRDFINHHRPKMMASIK
jgi:hypothetical protein